MVDRRTSHGLNIPLDLCVHCGKPHMFKNGAKYCRACLPEQIRERQRAYWQRRHRSHAKFGYCCDCGVIFPRGQKHLLRCPACLAAHQAKLKEDLHDRTDELKRIQAHPFPNELWKSTSIGNAQLRVEQVKSQIERLDV